GVKVAAWTDDCDSLLAHGLQVLPARDEVDVCASSVEGGADVCTNRARANDRDLHCPTNPARLRRCTLPVGPFGISGTIVKRAGRLKAASRSSQCAARSWMVASSRSTTTTPTCSPYFSSGTGYAAASATEGCASSTSSISYGEIFSPARLMSS